MVNVSTCCGVELEESGSLKVETLEDWLRSQCQLLTMLMFGRDVLMSNSNITFSI
jgi:hypothetical protein